MLTLLAVLWLAGLLILFAPSLFEPQFEVINQSSQAVSVTIVWRDHEKPLGRIEAGGHRRFSVDDEAAMVFRAVAANGKLIESEPIYFSRGSTVIAMVTGNTITVRHDVEK